jgi:hypothetical protein
VLPRLAPNGELYVVGADGRGERRLTTTKTDESTPAWSPDGTSIAIASDRHYPDGRSSELFVMNADGSCVTQVTLGGDAVTQPQWRPRRPVQRGACGVRLAAFQETADLGAVRARHAVPFFAGRAFEGMRIGHAEGRTVIYDECELADPGDCPGEIQIQTYSTCDRNPAEIDQPVESVYRLHGALVVEYGFEGGVDVLTGGTTVAVYQSLGRRGLRRLVRALRPIGGPELPLARLAAPRLPRGARCATRARRAAATLSASRARHSPAPTTASYAC